LNAVTPCDVRSQQQPYNQQLKQGKARQGKDGGDGRASQCAGGGGSSGGSCSDGAGNRGKGTR